MKMRNVWVLVLAVMLGSMSWAQDGSAPAGGQQGDRGAGQQRGRGNWRGGPMGRRGVIGTVTEVTPEHFTVKNEAGEMWTVHYSVNTRVMKQPARSVRSEGAAGAGPGGPGWQPETIKPSEIKAGDVIVASGEQDPAAKSVGAVMVMLLDADSVKRMREMQANFGKTWLMGRVSAINETKVTLHSSVDNADHTFVADENTSFRRRRDPVTLADVQVGDNVRVEGAVKDGQFVATTVNVMMPPAEGGPARRQGPPPQ